MKLHPKQSFIAIGMLTCVANAQAHPDLDVFNETAFVEDPDVVECSLENGSTAMCYEFVVAYQPDGLEIGPFCPETLDATGGIWDWDGDSAGVYRLDRAFFEMLAEQGYKFYDADENIAITNPGSGARPKEGHTCLMAVPDESVLITMLLPVDPVIADKPSALGTVAKVGVALDGVPIFADAPSVLRTGHLPALDVCGGHIDPGGWYHWHATATDIDTALNGAGVAADCNLAQDPAALFGYAFDGFPIFGSLETEGTAPQGLDECNGHVGTTALGETYHYHALEEFPNLPPCTVGVVASINFSTTAAAGIGSADVAQRDQQRGAPPGFEETARKLNVELEDLMNALGEPGQRPDIEAAAKALEVTEEALRDAMPKPPER